MNGSTLEEDGRVHRIPPYTFGVSQEPEDDDDLQPEYDFSGAVRGKYYERYQQGTNVVLLDPDVAQTFKDSESVNRALRLLVDLARHEIPERR